MNAYTVHANTYRYIQFFVLSSKHEHWKTSTYEYLSIHTQWLSATQHSDIPNSAGTTYPKRLQHNKSQTLKNVCNTAHTKLEYIPIQWHTGSCADHCKSQNHRAALDSPRHLLAALRLDSSCICQPECPLWLRVARAGPAMGHTQLEVACSGAHSTRPGLLCLHDLPVPAPESPGRGAAALNLKSTRPGLLWAIPALLVPGLADSEARACYSVPSMTRAALRRDCGPGTQLVTWGAAQTNRCCPPPWPSALRLAPTPTPSPLQLPRLAKVRAAVTNGNSHRMFCW